MILSLVSSLSATGKQRLKQLIILLIPVFTFLLVFLQNDPSEALGTSADAKVFAAGRAMVPLPFIAAAPRPVGAPGHQQMQRFLMSRLQNMGLEPHLQEATSIIRFPGAPAFSAGSVRNVLARVPGTAATGAIVVNAHYDGASTGPAAADCGACVITALESLRAILAGPPLKNDLILVFSDAEELGDLGAHAFAEQHPWMKDVRLAINFEAMGSSGPAYLYATNKKNNQLIKAYAKVAPRALSNSFLVGIFGLFPAQRLACDLQDYMNEGSAGYGFVFTGDISNYHTQLDKPELLDTATVQHLGDQTLALLRYFGDRDLSELTQESEAVFFTLWPGLLVHYPAVWSLPLAVIVLLLVLVLSGFFLHKGIWQAKGLISAVFTLLIGLLLVTTLVTIIWAGIKIINPDLHAFLIGSWGIDWWLAGLSALSVTGMMSFALLLRPRISFKHQLGGTILAFALLGLLLAVIYPSGSYLFLWPSLAGCLGLPLVYRSKHLSGTVLGALLMAVPVILLFGPFLPGANPFNGLLIRLDSLTGLPVLGIYSLAAAFLTAWLFSLLAAYPIGASPTKIKNLGRLVIFCLLSSILLLIIGSIRSRFDAEHPAPESIRYELQADLKQAAWVTGDARIGDWTRNFIPETTSVNDSPSSELLPDWPTRAVAPAPVIDLQPPQVELIEEQRQGNRRSLHLRLHNPRSAYMLVVDIQAEGPVLAAQLNGRPFELEDYAPVLTGRLRFNYAACPPEGTELRLEVEGTGPVFLSLVDIKNGLDDLPPQLVPPRPVGTMPSPLGADCTVVGHRVSI